MLGIKQTNDRKKKFNIHKVLNITSAVFTVFVAALAVLIFRSIKWMMDTWAHLSMEELVFHLKAPLEGTNSSMIISYITHCVILTVLVSIILSLCLRWLRNKKNVYYATMGVTLICSLILGTISIRYAWNTLDVSAYVNNQGTYSTFIDDHFVDPSTVNLRFPDEKRNLIYIYLESMEDTFADEESGGAKKENVIPELTKLSIENENFSGNENKLNGGYALTGATWTVAAMFAQTSGLPLTIPIDSNAMSSQDKFLPGVTSLGEILEKEGYQQDLLLGSDATFGGRKLYFEQHGNYDIYDYNYAIDNHEIPQDYHVWWGYEDRILFEQGKKRLNELAASDKPFNLTMLTVDTHFEDGYLCPDCPDTFDDQYSNVMACSSKQVTDFVEWIQQQPFYENTTIVISGDHPTMDSDFNDDVADEYVRKVYTTYINAPVQPSKTSYREYSTFDNYPTTLASLGVEIDGERLGLGTNLFSNRDTLSETYGNDMINRELSKKSLTMDRLTDYIESIHADVTLLGYNPVTKCIEVKTNNISWNKEVTSVLGGVWTGDSQDDLKWYESEPQEDGSYVLRVPVEDYGYKEDRYVIHMYATDKTNARLYVGGSEYRLNNNEIYEEDSNAENQGIQQADAEVTVEPYNYKAGKFSVNIDATASDVNIQAIRCAVWSEEDQSDLKWYEAKKKSDGTYVSSVWARDFYYKEATYTIHVYGINEDGVPVLIGEAQGLIE